MVLQIIFYKNPCTSHLKSNYKVYSFFFINFSNNYSSFQTLCFRVLNSLLFSDLRSLLSPSSMGPIPHLQNLSCQMTDSMIVYLALMYNSSLWLKRLYILGKKKKDLNFNLCLNLSSE